MRKYLFFCFLLWSSGIAAQPADRHHLRFDKLADVWDEGIPLGNGSIGALVWQKGQHLRFSLDRADIWDLRPMAGLHRDEFRFQWIQEQIRKDNYKDVQKYLDTPYDAEPAPTKIPAGALEFDISADTEVRKVVLSLEKARCEVEWANGMRLTTFVHATEAGGWFRFENITGTVTPVLIAPAYQGKEKEENPNSLIGDHLGRLGYRQGIITPGNRTLVYRQEGWGGFVYEIAVRWQHKGSGSLEGVWSISSHYPGKKAEQSSAVAGKLLRKGMDKGYRAHLEWWQRFWSRSAVQLPDSLLERQWYREQYKFGSGGGRGGPPPPHKAGGGGGEPRWRATERGG